VADRKFKIPESWWAWIVPLILLLWIGTAILTGCWPIGDNAAHAAAPSPSPSPAPDNGERAVAFNATSLIVTAIILAVVFTFFWRSMKKHEK